MRRRRFDHLFVELSVAVGRAVPRWDLWMAFHERGADPEWLSRAEALAFCDEQLPAWLAPQGLALGDRPRRRLRRAVARFDPRQPTPEECLGTLMGPRHTG